MFLKEASIKNVIGEFEVSAG